MTATGSGRAGVLPAELAEAPAVAEPARLREGVEREADAIHAPAVGAGDVEDPPRHVHGSHHQVDVNVDDRTPVGQDAMGAMEQAAPGTSQF